MSRKKKKSIRFFDKVFDDYKEAINNLKWTISSLAIISGGIKFIFNIPVYLALLYTEALFGGVIFLMIIKHFPYKKIYSKVKIFIGKIRIFKRLKQLEQDIGELKNVKKR